MILRLCNSPILSTIITLSFLFCINTKYTNTIQSYTWFTIYMIIYKYISQVSSDVWKNNRIFLIISFCLHWFKYIVKWFLDFNTTNNLFYPLNQYLVYPRDAYMSHYRVVIVVQSWLHLGPHPVIYVSIDVPDVVQVHDWLWVCPGYTYHRYSTGGSYVTL